MTRGLKGRKITPGYPFLSPACFKKFMPYLLVSERVSAKENGENIGNACRFCLHPRGTVGILEMFRVLVKLGGLKHQAVGAVLRSCKIKKSVFPGNIHFHFLPDSSQNTTISIIKLLRSVRSLDDGIR